MTLLCDFMTLVLFNFMTTIWLHDSTVWLYDSYCSWLWVQCCTCSLTVCNRSKFQQERHNQELQTHISLISMAHSDSHNTAAIITHKDTGTWASADQHLQWPKTGLSLNINTEVVEWGTAGSRGTGPPSAWLHQYKVISGSYFVQLHMRAHTHKGQH